jgi:predicted DNA-binding transcriptional regulator YafY
VPVYAELGASGGFSISEGWSAELNGMTSAEVQASVFAGMPGPAAELGLGVDAATARLKLLAATSPGADREAFKIVDRFHFDPVPWHHQSRPPVRELRAVAQAVWEKRRLRIAYESWERTSVKTLEPLGLVLKAGAWYFVCAKRERSVVYKVDKVRSATVLAEPFQRPKNFDLAKAWADSVANFEAGLLTGTAVLRVTKAGLSGLERLGGAMAEPIRAALPDRFGVRVATVRIETLGHAAALLMAAGTDIEVLAPSELRGEMSSRAAALLSLYSKAESPGPDRVASQSRAGRKPAG